ncbi:MAG: M24 family metallopeptidase [Parcubacteria group bacterium]|nr:M24 family metallopeptidase [Parcubacteria group bacterium]
MLGEQKLDELWVQLDRLNLDVFVVATFEGLTVPSVNPFYLTGYDGDTALVMLVPSQKEMYLFVPPLGEEAAKLVFFESQVRAVKGVSSFITELSAFCPHASSRVGFESGVLSYGLAERLRAGLSENVAKVTFVPLRSEENPIFALRRKKTEVEIEKLMNAQEITAEALHNVMRRNMKSSACVGMTEREVAARLEYEMRCLGASRMAFPTIVASGARSALPHGFASEKKITAGDMVQFDFGAVYGGYCGDFSRVMVVGRGDRELLVVAEKVLDALRLGISLCKPGAKCREIHREAIEFLGEYAQFFVHSLGHGVGLDIHEAPWLSATKAPEDMVLEVGDVVTVEPGVYLPGRGGVRLEEMVVIREDGPEVLATSIYPPDKMLTF